MKTHNRLLALALLSSSMLSSCIWQPFLQTFTRDDFPGVRPPMVIEDADGKPAKQSWLKTEEHMLPLSTSSLGQIEYAEDGLPYGITSEFSNIVISPYSPHYQLDYTGVKVGAKVWDPYTRKPFYIKRAYTFN